MSPEEDIIYVHSVAEAYLYLKASLCRSCRKGSLNPKADLTKTAAAPGGWMLSTVCSECGAAATIHFCINPPPTREQAHSQEINPTPHRSSAIDLLGWLTLFQAIIEASQRETDKQAARELAYEAALCLDEAMKFYDGDNELPAEDAFFNETSRRRFRDNPQQFARSKWRERRLKLPDATTRTIPAGPRRPRRRWWQFWRGSAKP
ncbi:MAG TPA: hypothetical protein VMV94_12010 [Phycisphaerae bacterium]|nr:hypothetical protein [Phycisphaerae bacterium]